jgi:hypothetical protein
MCSGELTGQGVASRQINLAPLHKLKSDSAASPIKDIRMLHPTLTSQDHVLLLTLVLGVSTSNSSTERHLGQLPQSLYDEDRDQYGSSSSSVNRRPSTAGARKLAAISKRARGLTLVGTAEEGSNSRKGSASSSNASTTFGASTVEVDGHEVEQTFLLAFTSMAERWEWYTLLLSLCPPPKAARQQRKLAIKILDLQERSNGASGQSRGDEASLHMGSSIDTRSVRGREGKVKGGWAMRDRMCCEV